MITANVSIWSDIVQIDSTPAVPPPRHPDRDHALRAAAQQLEAGFLAEMLKATGIGKPSEGFGGGTGEAQFSSFLVQTYADRLAEAGGVGLAEQIFQSLKDRE